MSWFSRRVAALCVVQSIDCQHASIGECSENSVDSVAMLQSVASMSADRANSGADAGPHHGIPHHVHHGAPSNHHAEAAFHELLSNKKNFASDEPHHSGADIDGLMLRHDTREFYEPYGLSESTIRAMMGVVPDSYNGFSPNHAEAVAARATSHESAEVAAAAQDSAAVAEAAPHPIVAERQPTGHTMVSAYPGLAHSDSAQADVPSTHAALSHHAGVHGKGRSGAAVGTSAAHSAAHHAHPMPNHHRHGSPHTIHNSPSALHSAGLKSNGKAGVKAAVVVGQGHHLLPGHRHHSRYGSSGKKLSAYDMLSAIHGESHSAGTGGKMETGAGVRGAAATSAAQHHRRLPHQAHGPPHFYHSPSAAGVSADAPSVLLATQEALVTIDADGNAVDAASNDVASEAEGSNRQEDDEGSQVPHEDSVAQSFGVGAEDNATVLASVDSENDAVVLDDAGIDDHASAIEDISEVGKGDSAEVDAGDLLADDAFAIEDADGGADGSAKESIRDDDFEGSSALYKQSVKVDSSADGGVDADAAVTEQSD